MTLTIDVDSQMAFGGSAAVVIRNYPGRSQVEAASMFAQEAEIASREGYLPVSQSWGEGRSGIRRVALIGFGSLVWKPKGFLTVTYTKQGAGEVEATGGTEGAIEDMTNPAIVTVPVFRAPWGPDLTIPEWKLWPDGDVWFQIKNASAQTVAAAVALVSWWSTPTPFRELWNPEVGMLEYLIPGEDGGERLHSREVKIDSIKRGQHTIKVKGTTKPEPDTQARVALYAVARDGKWVTGRRLQPADFLEWERRHAPPEPAAPEVKTCPMCAEEVKAAAKICRFCRYEFEPIQRG